MAVVVQSPVHSVSAHTHDAPPFTQYLSDSQPLFPFESKHCPLPTLSFSDRSSPPPPTTAVDTQGIEDQEVEDEVAKITQKSKSEAESSHEQTETMPQCEGVLGDFERRTCANPNTTLEEIEFRKVCQIATTISAHWLPMCSLFCLEKRWQQTSH